MEKRIYADRADANKKAVAKRRRKIREQAVVAKGGNAKYVDMSDGLAHLIFTIAMLVKKNLVFLPQA